MKKSGALFIPFLILLSCSFEKSYLPNDHMTVEQQVLFMNRVIRYMSRAPDGVGPEDRFDPTHDEHYTEQLKIHRLDALYKDGETFYFLVSRIAPSLTEKRLAIGGKATVDENIRVTYYEEVFRTWKMAPDSLAKRGPLLFNKMVNGEDLVPYYSSRSGNTDYIEFPDDRTYFDTNQRIWRTK
jgi:hypothetical protein